MATGPDLYSSCTLAGINLDGGRDAYGHGYELHGDTRSTRSLQWRKQSVDNPWVEGSYDISAVRENVVEELGVWVYGSSHSDLEQKITAITQALGTASFSVVWTTGTASASQMSETWDCTFSDYEIQTQREYQYANMAVVKISLNRRPRVTRVYADSTTYAG